MDEYENIRRVVYGEDRATFIPICVKCKRFVKAPETMSFNIDGGLVDSSNKTSCSSCGETQMIFEGFI